MHLHVHVSVVYNQHMVSRRQITMKCILLSKYVQCTTNYYCDCYYYHFIICLGMTMKTIKK